jgi:hypothetical protein
MMMRMLLFGALASALASCESPTERTGLVVVSPQAESYAAPAAVTVIVRNDTRETIWVSRCGVNLLVAVERQVGVRWENVSDDVCIASTAHVPLTLEPGESAEGSVDVNAPGIYRVVATYFQGARDGLLWTPSTPFTVE